MIDLTQVIRETPAIAVPENYGIYRSDAQFIIELRRKVIQPGLPLKNAGFDGDNLVSTWHFFLAYPIPHFETADMVCCASFMLNSYQNEPAYQLRGMATDPRFQKRGFGKILLDAAESTIVQKTGIRLFWCNARMTAIPFYEKKCRWTAVGPAFDIPEIGLHRIMFKKH